MMDKKHLWVIIPIAILISSGVTYMLTKKENPPFVKEIQILKESIVVLEDKISVYERTLQLTNDYFSGKDISDSEFENLTSDSLIVATINNINLYQSKRLTESVTSRSRVIVDTLIQIEKDQRTEDELAKVKSELSLVKEKMEKPEKTKEVLNIVSAKGKKVQYLGETENGKANGYGEGIFETGSVYKGYWKDNLRHGVGVFTWSDKEYYEGSFVEGKREGYGEYHWKNGEVYKGYWKNDMRHGKGSLYKKNGKLKKEGVWVNDELK